MCANIKNIELTDEIKEEILGFRKHYPKPVPTAFIPIVVAEELVNNFNIMNNYLNTLDAPDKYISYRTQSICDI